MTLTLTVVDVAYNSQVTLKNYKTNGGFLHSHLQHYPKEVGPPIQQVTSYSHKDSNNHWIIRPISSLNPNKIIYIIDGDMVKLEHKTTEKYLYSHDQPAPLTPTHGQIGAVVGSDGDENTIFQLKVIHGHQDQGRISPIFTVFQLVHVNEECSVECKGKQLPKWALEQKELTCNPDVSSHSASLWNIEELTDNRIPGIRLDWIHSRPGFISKLIETHLVMFSNNRNLKPKPDEFRSRPWMWPLAYRGQLFSTEPHILMLGNPFTHWLILLLLVPTCALFISDAVKYQRAKAYTTQETALAPDPFATYRKMGWLALAWMLHYLPFWPMTRVLYPHHYLPAYVFSAMFTGMSLDHMLCRITNQLPSSISSATKYLTVTAICLLSAASFYALSPIVYGYDSSEDTNPMLRYKLLEFWDF